LPTRTHVAAYLEEAARGRKVAFETLTDADLPKRLHYPDATATTLGEILLTTLSHASHHRGQVYAYVHLFSDARLPATGARGFRARERAGA
jgi:uncharacterized damage-inducible protein DinB